MEQVQKQHTPREQEEPVEETVKTSDNQDLKNELDALLDEVDKVLEENEEAFGTAQDFVNAFVQKGGE